MIRKEHRTSLVYRYSDTKLFCSVAFTLKTPYGLGPFFYEAMILKLTLSFHYGRLTILDNVTYWGESTWFIKNKRFLIELRVHQKTRPECLRMTSIVYGIVAANHTWARWCRHSEEKTDSETRRTGSEKSNLKLHSENLYRRSESAEACNFSFQQNAEIGIRAEQMLTSRVCQVNSEARIMTSLDIRNTGSKRSEESLNLTAKFGR